MDGAAAAEQQRARGEAPPTLVSAWSGATPERTRPKGVGSASCSEQRAGWRAGPLAGGSGSKAWRTGERRRRPAGHAGQRLSTHHNVHARALPKSLQQLRRRRGVAAGAQALGEDRSRAERQGAARGPVAPASEHWVLTNLVGGVEAGWAAADHAKLEARATLCRRCRRRQRARQAAAAGAQQRSQRGAGQARQHGCLCWARRRACRLRQHRWQCPLMGEHGMVRLAAVRRLGLAGSDQE